MSRRLLMLFALTAVLTAPLLALPEPTPEEVRANRVRLAEVRQHPQQMARLEGTALVFQAAPDDRREKAHKLDQDLHREPAADQARHLSVLERYSRWLGRLPAADREAVVNAPSTADRLAVIRALRDRDWMRDQLPETRKRWEALQGAEKADYLGQLRAKERRCRQEWRLALRFWKELAEHKQLPSRITDLDPFDQVGVAEYLIPMLNDKEKQRLHDAQGSWPEYPLTLLDLSDEHPLALPSKSNVGPRSLSELPSALQTRFDMHIPGTTTKGADLLKNKMFVGKWPDFAKWVASTNYRNYNKEPLPRELWACAYSHLGKPMQDYVTTLKQFLSQDEQTHLESDRVTGHWPDYPNAIQKLANGKGLPPPPWETVLSDSRGRWNDYRTVRRDERPEAAAKNLRDGKAHE